MPAARSTAEWQAADAAHFLHPFTDFKALAAKGARIIERAEGIYLWDTDGRRLLDSMSGLWCVNVGYGRRELIAAATRQLEQLPFYNSFFQATHPPAIALAERLARLAPPGFEHVFFTNSGSEANDTVVRMVRRYWDVLGAPARQIIIGRHNGYHGSTMAGASLGGMADMHAQGGLPIPGIEHIEQPHWFELGAPLERDEFGRVAAGWLDARIRALGADRVAAFIGEPVQGAGGVIVPPDTYWPEIRRICDRHGVLLVADEVICGFGRTGRWFGCDRFGFVPDLVTFAKGVTSGYIPLGGVLVGGRVASALIERGAEFTHGFTYSGHPVGCAVALANLDVLEGEGIVERVRDELGPCLAERLGALTTHPLVGEVQSCGLMAALQLVGDKAAGRRLPPASPVGRLFRDHAFEQGVVMRALGTRLILAPPLVITPAQIDEMVALIVRCLDLAHADAARHGLL